MISATKLSRVRSQSRMAGITLMELMIVVVIVGILASVSYPAYQEYGRRAKRAEGRAALMDAAARQERYYSDENQYGTIAQTRINAQSESDHYDISVTLGPNNQTFTITAQPGFTDAKCGDLTLNNTGVKSSTGAHPDCWGR